MGSQAADALAPFFLGAFIAAALWGVSTIQVGHYFFTRSGDSTRMKLLVAVVWLVDTAHQILILQPLYSITVSHFGDFVFMQGNPTSDMGQIICLELVVLIVQSFYVYRIWRLSKRHWVPVTLILVFMAAEVALSSFDVALVSRQPTIADVQQYTGRISAFAFVVMLCADTVITGTMCFILSNNRTQYANTNSVITKLLVFTLSTNMLTSVWALTIVIVVLRQPTSMLCFPLYNLIPRLYTNSLMAALNMRPYFAGHASGDASGVTDSLRMWQMQPRRDVPRDRGLSVRVDTTVISMYDLHDEPPKMSQSKARHGRMM